MSLSLYGGKILAGVSVAALGTGGVIVYTQKPEWFGMNSKKTSGENLATSTSDWIISLGLNGTCDKNSSNKTCDLNKEAIEKLGFVFGSINKEGVVVTKPTSNPSASLKWKEIADDQNRFSFGLMFTISSKSGDLEILKASGEQTDKITIPTTGMEFGLIKDGEKYYFKKLEQTDKEKNAGMNCDGNNPCSLMKEGTNVNGLTSNVTINKHSDSDETRFLNGFRYTVSGDSTNNQNGDYQLKLEEGENKWKLIKVASRFSKWDDLASKSSTWNAQLDNETKPKKITVSVSNNSSGITNSAFWECEITTNKEVESGKTLELSGQFETLKTNLWIDQTGDKNSNVDSKRKNFVEKCSENRDTNHTPTSLKKSLANGDKVQSKIELTTEKKGDDDNTLQLTNTNFNNLFEQSN